MARPEARNLFLGCKSATHEVRPGLAVGIGGGNAAYLQGAGRIGIGDAIVRISDLEFAGSQQCARTDRSHVAGQPESADLAEFLDDLRPSGPYRDAGHNGALQAYDRVTIGFDPDGALNQKLILTL